MKTIHEWSKLIDDDDPGFKWKKSLIGSWFYQAKTTTKMIWRLEFGSLLGNSNGLLEIGNKNR